MERSGASEMMDAPDVGADLLVGDLRNLRLLNRYLGNYRNVLHGLARLCGDRKRFSLLDVGTGSADIPSRIIDWAQRRSINPSIVGVEPNPITAQVAATLTQQNPPVIPDLQRGKEGDFRCGEIAILRGDGMALPFRPKTFDFVLASQVLHHFSEERIVALLRHWSAVARCGIIISDLVRHPLPCYGIALLTRLFTRNVMTRTDAPLSVRRGFTMGEWQKLFDAAQVGSFEVHWMWPFRLLALIKLSQPQ